MKKKIQNGCKVREPLNCTVIYIGQYGLSYVGLLGNVSLHGTSAADAVILGIDHHGPTERHDALMVLAQIVVTVVLVIWLTVIVYGRRWRRRGHYQRHGVRLVAANICTQRSLNKQHFVFDSLKFLILQYIHT